VRCATIAVAQNQEASAKNRTYPKALFVRLPERTAARLQEVAHAREQTIAEFVRQVLRQALDEASERPVV